MPCRGRGEEAFCYRRVMYGYGGRRNAHFWAGASHVSVWNAIGTPLERSPRKLSHVCMGQPAAAAVVDMPVGAPPPFASALEQAPVGTRTKRGLAWLGHEDL